MNTYYLTRERRAVEWLTQQLGNEPRNPCAQLNRAEISSRVWNISSGARLSSTSGEV